MDWMWNAIRVILMDLSKAIDSPSNSMIIREIKELIDGESSETKSSNESGSPSSAGKVVNFDELPDEIKEAIEKDDKK